MLITRFFRIAQEEIHRYGGTVEKFIGDAVMCVFGLTIAHEDDAERAIRAAASIRSRVQSDVEAGPLPELRIGINTGEVVASITVPGSGEFLITGEMVNLAVRLQQHAQPGQILVGETTYANSHWVFEYGKLPAFEIKNRTGKVLAYEYLGPLVQPAIVPHGFPRGMRSPLIARSSELALLKGCIDQLFAGRGSIVTILGEPGIGKSRLVTEVRRQVADRDLLWLEGRGLSFNRQVSYSPIIEILRGAMGITQQDTEIASWAKLEATLQKLFPDHLNEIIPYLAMLLGLPIKPDWEERVRYLRADAVARQIYRSCRLLFEKLAQKRPLVLVFEDLHWVDESSAELLEHLLPLTDAVPLLLCGIGRPELHSPVDRLRNVASQGHASYYTEIPLFHLSQLDSVQLACNLLGYDDLPSRLRTIILQKTEGNPLFVEEIVRALIDAKAVNRNIATARRRTNGSGEEIALPDTLRGIIVARTDRLGEEAKLVLKTASVIGRIFSYRVLCTVEDSKAIDRALADLQEAEFIRERARVPDLEYTFKHALIQEAVYESILLRQRRELHRKVGEAITKLFINRLSEFYSVLSFHYARAEDWEKTQEYLFKAGDQAAKVAADAEALAHYRQAIAEYSRVFGDRWQPLKRATLERKIGEALFRRGEHQQAMEHLQQALVCLGSSFPNSRWAIRVEILRQTLQQLGHRLVPSLLVRRTAEQISSTAEERTRIYEAMAWIDYFVRPERLLLEALTAMNVAERAHLLLGIARGAMGLGYGCDFLRLFWLAESYHARAIAIAEQIQHPLAVGLVYLGSGLHELHAHGRYDKSLEHFERSAAAYRLAGELRQWGAAATMVAWVLRLKGEFTQGLTRSKEVIEIGRDAADPQVWGWGLAMHGAILLRTGQLEKAVALLQQSIELFKRVPDHVWVVIASSGLGSCYLRQGRSNEAIRVLEESNRLVSEYGFMGYDRSQPLPSLAEAYLLAAEKCENEERDRWLRIAQRTCRAALKQCKADAEIVPAANRIQGSYQWLTNHPFAARQWWLRSIQASERLGARYDLGLTYLEMGKRLGQSEYLIRARTIFAEIGAREDESSAQEPLGSRLFQR